MRRRRVHKPPNSQKRASKNENNDTNQFLSKGSTSTILQKFLFILVPFPVNPLSLFLLCFITASVLAIVLYFYYSVQKPQQQQPNRAIQTAPVYGIKILENYPHDIDAFTQGLVYNDNNNILYESTGLHGKSSVRRVQIHDGVVSDKTMNNHSDFGEGLTLIHDGSKLLQLFWKVGYAHIFDTRTLQHMHTVNFPELKDGWGVSTGTSSSSIFVSDGTHRIREYHIDKNHNVKLKSQFNVVSLSPQQEIKNVSLINELEFINGELWANILFAEVIARIDVLSGHVIGWIDCRGIIQSDHVPKGHRLDVLNGIAYNRKADIVYITGKLWPKVYAIKVNEQPISGTRKRLEDFVNPFFMDEEQVKYVHEKMLV